MAPPAMALGETADGCRLARVCISRKRLAARERKPLGWAWMIRHSGFFASRLSEPPVRRRSRTRAAGLHAHRHAARLRQRRRRLARGARAATRNRRELRQRREPPAQPLRLLATVLGKVQTRARPGSTRPVVGVTPWRTRSTRCSWGGRRGHRGSIDSACGRPQARVARLSARISRTFVRIAPRPIPNRSSSVLGRAAARDPRTASHAPATLAVPTASITGRRGRPRIMVLDGQGSGCRTRARPRAARRRPAASARRDRSRAPRSPAWPSRRRRRGLVQRDAGGDDGQPIALAPAQRLEGADGEGSSSR